MKQMLLTEAEWLTITQAAATLEDGRAVLPILSLMRLTGCRPQEARPIKAEHIDHEAQCICAIEGNEIRLIDEAYNLVRDLADKHPSGPIFRDHESNPWTSSSLGCATESIAKKSGIKFCYYNLRPYKRLA